MVQSFTRSLNSRFDKLRKSIRKGDTATVTQNAHAAAGASSTIGAALLASTFRTLEEEAGGESLTNAERLISLAGEEFERVKTFLTEQNITPSETLSLTPKPTGSRVLIIEDDPFVTNLYRTRLEREKFQVESAKDGQEGFYKIHEWRPNLILLDLMLPEMAGVSILRKIRAEKAYKELPVLVFTNSLVPSMLNDAIDAGATEVFNKANTGPEQLIAAIHAALFPLLPPRKLTQSAEPLSTAPAGEPTTNTPPVSRTPEPGATPPADEPTPTRRPRFDISPAEKKPTPASAPEPTPLPADPSTPSEPSESETSFRKSVFASAPELITNLRHDYLSFSRAAEPDQQVDSLAHLYHRVHALTGTAGMSSLHAISDTTAALELLITELRRHPDNITSSTSRTIAQAIDLLGRLLKHGQPVVSILEQKPTVLVVDDDDLSREAVDYALTQAKIRTLPVHNAQAALNVVKHRKFDLIILDVGLPGMDGFELCKAIRETSNHKETPTVFLTGRTDEDTRSHARASGARDFITKPFLVMEMIVKAVVHILSARMK